MSHVHHYDTLTDLWHGEIHRQLFARRRDIDYISGSDTIQYDCLLSCDSMSFDFDSGRDLWLMAPRFTTLQRAYLDLDNLTAFLARCEKMNGGDAKRGVVTSMFAKQHGNQVKKYQWGNCMLAWDFRGGAGLKPELTLHSRVSYIAYIGGLDLALCHVLAREIGERIGCDPEEFGFRWFLSSSQFHYFKSLPCLYALGYEQYLEDGDRWPSSKYPTLAGLRKDHNTVVRKRAAGTELAEERFGPRRRVNRRFREYKDGTAYSVPLESLNFNPLRNAR